MCARVTLTTPVSALRQLFRFRELLNLAPRYNATPTQMVPIVRLTLGDDAERELILARWGLVPSWAKDMRLANKMINAQAEGIATKPAFRAAWKHRRYLVPADGFYEWQKVGKVKQPFLVRPKSGEPFAFAGLWDRWRDPEGGSIITYTIITYTIITTDANEVVATLHRRMPVILGPEDHERWLHPKRGGAELLRPCPGEWLEAYPVDRRVRDTRQDDPGLIEPLVS